MGDAKMDEKVLHKAFKMAFGNNEDLIIRKNFNYTDETGTVREMDHIIIDKQRKILIVFSDKSFEKHSVNRANEKYKASVDQNLDFIKGIELDPEIRIGSGKQAERIKLNDISSWYCIICFNVIYPVVNTGDTRYINLMHNVKYNTVLDDTSKKDYRQLTIGYHSLLRILEYCSHNKIEFIEFIQILRSIYDANREWLDFGIGIQSAFECAYEDKKYQDQKLIHLVIADTKQNRLQINHNKYKFYCASPYIISVGCLLKDFTDVVNGVDKEVKLKVLSSKRYNEILHLIIDRIIDIHMLDILSRHKLKRSISSLSERRHIGVLIIGYKVYNLDESDIEHIINRISNA